MSSNGIRRGNAVDDTYATIRDRIIAGVYRPGLGLSQVQLAAELEVSRTPLREAFRRLEAENLVINQANRGVVVAPLELSDVEDSYAVRLLVEPALISAILGEVTASDIDAMSVALSNMRRPGISPREFQLSHWEYHRVLLGRCPAGMREMIESHLTRIDRHQRLYFSHPAAVEDVTTTDGMFLEAVREHDGGLARYLLEFHLLDTALGLIMSGDPGHVFGSLPVALAGMAIRLNSVERLRGGGFAEITWDRGHAETMPALRTTNLASSSDPLVRAVSSPSV
ncbi:GntR family transcriptional regulator [Rhodococcus sp. KBS0724]|uniref:GntR family transcriptional regulator n=1 Tax=Rhodococcus sp. KBS0724 TaxID=1179674 RepID=UPI00110D8D03|nr:GntR family transcriptional regulator [Rhodococcus sp. KBS0724]TSD40261.1 GntR family transcriptional regulator [Rhodococcus sp. KBS0724]